MNTIKSPRETPRTLPRIASTPSLNYNLNNARTPGSGQLNRNLFGFASVTPGRQGQLGANRNNMTLNTVRRGNTVSNFGLNRSLYGTPPNAINLTPLYDTVEGLIANLELRDCTLVFSLSSRERPQDMFDLYRTVFNSIPEEKLELVINNNSLSTERNVKTINEHLAAFELKENGHPIQLNARPMQTSPLTAESLKRWLEVLIRVLNEVVLPLRQLVAEHRDRMASKPENNTFLCEHNNNLDSLVALEAGPKPDRAAFMRYLQMEKESTGSYESNLDSLKRLQEEQARQKWAHLQRRQTDLKEEIRQLKVCFHLYNYHYLIH